MALDCGKRAFRDDSNIAVKCSKKSRQDYDEDASLHAFMSWFKSQCISLNNKVCVTVDGSCAQYGMVAVSSIEAGEILFEIPRSMLLSSSNCSISDIFKQESDSLRSDSGWVTLLLAIIHETINPNSKWKPYLDLLPDYNELDLPMFWPRHELESLLSGTGIVEAVRRDMESINNEFNSIAFPFMQRHPDLFPPSCQKLDCYMKAIAFVMAYSFTEPASLVSNETSSDDSEDEDESQISSLPPMMVPMADILNHIAKNNAQLDFGVDSLKMVATKSIIAGEEIFNTYGELPNWQLLHMYGFSEQHADNHFDSMDLPMKNMFSILTRDVSADEMNIFEQKWNFLKQVEVVTDDGAFVLGANGFLTEEEMYQTLKVMTMSRQAFEDHREKEGWSDAEDESRDDTSESLSFEDICKLSSSWKDLLKKIALHFLKTRSCEASSIDGDAHFKTIRRQRFANFVKEGQHKMLNQLLNSCS